jgi:hypothetical protein
MQDDPFSDLMNLAPTVYGKAFCFVTGLMHVKGHQEVGALRLSRH